MLEEEDPTLPAHRSNREVDLRSKISLHYPASSPRLKK